MAAGQRSSAPVTPDSSRFSIYPRSSRHPLLSHIRRCRRAWKDARKLEGILNGRRRWRILSETIDDARHWVAASFVIDVALVVEDEGHRESTLVEFSLSQFSLSVSQSECVARRYITYILLRL